MTSKKIYDSLTPPPPYSPLPQSYHLFNGLSDQSCWPILHPFPYNIFNETYQTYNNSVNLNISLRNYNSKFLVKTHGTNIPNSDFFKFVLKCKFNRTIFWVCDVFTSVIVITISPLLLKTSFFLRRKTSWS